jgi:hypothetical protein
MGGGARIACVFKTGSCNLNVVENFGSFVIPGLSVLPKKRIANFEWAGNLMFRGAWYVSFVCYVVSPSGFLVNRWRKKTADGLPRVSFLDTPRPQKQICHLIELNVTRIYSTFGKKAFTSFAECFHVACIVRGWGGASRLVAMHHYFSFECRW